MSESSGQVLWAFGFAGLGVLRRSTSSLAGRGPPATGGSPRQTPCLPWNFLGNWWQPVATVLACFPAFAPNRFAADCHLLQPRGSIKMTCSETSSAQACYARDVVDVDGARGGPDEDRRRTGCASKADHVQDARPGVG